MMKSLYFKCLALIDQTPTKVDMPKRLGAYLVDWIVGGILTGLPAVLIYGAVSGRSDMFSDLYVFESLGLNPMWAYISGILCILLGIFYYVIVPLKIYPGQTLGKKWAGIRVVKLNGDRVDLKTMLMRQVVGIFLIEGAVYIVSNYIRQLVTLSLRFYVDYYWQLFGMAVTLISVILIVKTLSHRAIHDYIAHTKLELVEGEQTK